MRDSGDSCKAFSGDSGGIQAGLPLGVSFSYPFHNVTQVDPEGEPSLNPS